MPPSLPVILGLLAGCGAPTPVPSSICADDTLAAGEVEVFATGFVDPTGTEGLTFDPAGRLFVGGIGVGGGGFVAEVQPDGSWERLLDVAGSIGLVHAFDTLLVATSNTGDGSAGLIAVDPDARTKTVFATGLPGANFAVGTPWGTLLVSDPSGDAIFEVDAQGTWSTWAEGVPSPNGMAFSPDGSVLYVANTYVNPSTVGQIEIQGAQAGPIGVLATLPDASTQDGVAIDSAGNLYVVENLPGLIVRIQPDGTWDQLASGVDYGASLEFGRGAFDPCSLYVTSLFGPDVYRVGVGEIQGP